MKYIAWKNDKYVIAGTSLRCVEEKENGNLALNVEGDRNAIIENRKKFSIETNIPMNHWVFQEQTHSDHINKVDITHRGSGVYDVKTAISDSDALYTRDKNVAIGVFHADCVPVLLYDPIEGIICAIHSGWQGTVQEITRKAVLHLINTEQCNPRNMKAYIGPSISYHSFEVGMDVIERVKQMSFDTNAFIHYLSKEKALLDGKGLNEKMLLDAGLLEQHITIDKNDTFAQNDALFSYRRDHLCGRHLSFIMRK